MNPIKFGTSGWRGVLAEDFTYSQVKKVVWAIGSYIQARKLADKGLIVGYDTRFMGKEFAEAAAQVLAAQGIPVFLCQRDTPTPTIAYEILRRQAAGALNFTASHNPYNYNGIKFSPQSGGPALPETTKEIERLANSLSDNDPIAQIPLEQAKNKNLVTEIDPCPPYLEKLRSLVDFNTIGGAQMPVVVDPMHGTSRGYLDRLLQEEGAIVSVIHDHRDPYFGGKPPEPAEENVEKLIHYVREEKAWLGLATDGDADRFGIVDADGTVIIPNAVLALILQHLITVRKLKGAVARSFATTHLIDAVARKHGLEVIETPVGFKYLGELIIEDKIIMGGEESAGMSIKNHVPEKDGILACLLVAEIVAHHRKSLKQLLEELYKDVGRILSTRINLPLTAELRLKLEAKLANPPAEIGGLKVKSVQRVDGTKLFFQDNSWILLRLSGTEPVARFYAEAPSQKALKNLVEEGRRFIYS
jgi:alpha-D-glucose phosphate-specific phosphoglucomutase